MDKRVGLKRYELDGRKVLFYFDEVSPTALRVDPRSAGRVSVCGSGLFDSIVYDIVVCNAWTVCVCVCVFVFIAVYSCVFLWLFSPMLGPLPSDSQPVYDLCELPGREGVYSRQDGARSGQSLRLLRTRWASPWIHGSTAL